VLEDIPKPSELCRVSGRNGGQFTNHVLKTWALTRPRIGKTSDTDGRHRGADKFVDNGRLLIINVRNRKDSSTKYRRNSTW
jgi:hypothetical protein